MPVKSEKERLVKDGQTSTRAYRPAGFGEAATKKAPAEETETAGEDKKAPKKRGLFAFLKRDKDKKKKRVKKPRAKRVKKPQAKAKRKRIGRTELITVAIILLVLGAATTAVIVINGSKTVHQMPVILRNTEEPTAAPENE